MFDYIGGTICFFPLNWLLGFGFLCPCYLLMIQSECTHRKSHLQNKKSIITLYIIRKNALDAFLWPFLVLTTLFTLGVNRMDH